MSKTTIEELNDKTWYRLIKVLYVLSFIFVSCLIISITYYIEFRHKVEIDKNYTEIKCNWGNEKIIHANLINPELDETDFRYGSLMSANKLESIRSYCLQNYEEKNRAIKDLNLFNLNGNDFFVITPVYKKSWILTDLLTVIFVRLLISVIIFELIRRIFYYVIIGSFMPSKRSQKLQK